MAELRENFDLAMGDEVWFRMSRMLCKIADVIKKYNWKEKLFMGGRLEWEMDQQCNQSREGQKNYEEKT